MKGKILLERLLIAVVASLILALPFMGSSRTETGSFLFQIRLASSVKGMVQLFYDLGRGFTEADSAQIEVEAGEQPALLNFPLPAGVCRALRFDPINDEAKVTFGEARIVSHSGQLLALFPAQEFVPTAQIAAQEVHGDTVTITTAQGANDPILRIPLPNPLVLGQSRFAAMLPVARRFLVVFGCVAGLLFGLGAAPRAWRARVAAAIAGRWTQLAAHPVRILALAAALAVTVSSYPVVFLGKSYVSPNYGTLLLYDRFPTLPDSTDARLVDAKGADVGAIIWQHVPFSMMQHRALAQDWELPLWNRYNSTGVALLGQGQSMFGDPLHFLAIAADGAVWAWDLKYLVAKWLFAFGLGLIVWRLTRHPPSAVLTSIASAFIGFFVFRVNHPAFFSLCYAPWILYCWVRIVETSSWRPWSIWTAWLLLASWAELNSGTVKEAYMLLAGLNLSGAIALAASPHPWPVKLRAGALLTAAGGIFALLAAPVWLTFLETLQRSYTSYDASWVYQIQPGMMLGLFDELFYRPLQHLQRVFCPSVNFLFLLGALYFVATLRRGGHARPVLGLAAAALLPLSLAFGFIPPDWIQSVPFLANVSHVDNTFSCVLIILLIPLAGVGFHTAWRRLETPEGRGDAAVVIALLGALVFGYVAFGQVVHRQLYGLGETFTVWRLGERLPVDGFVWSSLWALLAASVALLAVFRRVRRQGEVTLATGFLAAACLFAMLWRHGMHAGNGQTDYVLHAAGRADLHAQSPAVETIRADRAEPFRVVGVGDVLLSGWTGVYGIEGVSGPDALMNRRVRELLDACEFTREWDWRRVVRVDTLSLLMPVCDFLNVKYYLAPAGDRDQPAGLLQPVVRADLNIYRSETPWPRAFFTDQVLAYDVPLQLAALIRANPGRPFAAVQRGDRTAPAPRLRSSPTVVAARDYRLTTNSTSFEVTAPRAGVIVLQEAWLRQDFVATVNGRPAPYFRVNHAFKGIAVDAPGTFKVKFTYRPRSFRLALGLSAAGFLALGAGWAVVRKLPE